MCVYKIKEQLLKERPKHMKQLTLDDMFKNACKNSVLVPELNDYFSFKSWRSFGSSSGLPPLLQEIFRT